MNYEELRNYLIKNPDLSRDIIKRGFIESTGDDSMSRLLSSTQRKGIKITAEVDDDNLTQEERKKRDADLADKAIRILMGGK